MIKKIIIRVTLVYLPYNHFSPGQIYIQIDTQPAIQHHTIGEVNKDLCLHNNPLCVYFTYCTALGKRNEKKRKKRN